MGLKELNALVEEIEQTDDRLLRSEILIDLSKDYHEVPAAVAVRPFSVANRAPACQSDAFVWVTKDSEGKLNPYFAVENPQGLSAKALAALISRAMSGSTLQEISQIPEDIVIQVFGETISMGKGEGLKGMIRKMKSLAAQV